MGKKIERWIILNGNSIFFWSMNSMQFWISWRVIFIKLHVPYLRKNSMHFYNYIVRLFFLLNVFVELRGYVEACKGQSISGIGKKGKDGKFRLVESTTFHQFCDSFRCVDLIHERDSATVALNNDYCKPTIICDFISWFTWDELVFLLQLYGKYWSVVRNIHHHEALVNLTKISYMRLKVGLQYVFLFLFLHLAVCCQVDEPFIQCVSWPPTMYRRHKDNMSSWYSHERERTPSQTL